MTVADPFQKASKGVVSYVLASYASATSLEERIVRSRVTSDTRWTRLVAAMNFIGRLGPA